MLPGQNSGRRDHDDLPSGKGDRRSRPQGDLRLAEADISADETVHRSAGRKIRKHGLDGFGLVCRFRVGETSRERRICRARRRECIGLRCLSLLRNFSQMPGCRLDILGNFFALFLPGLRVQSIKRYGLRLGAIAPQFAEVLHRHEKRASVAIFKARSVMGHAVYVYALQVLQNADTVFFVNDDIADLQLRLGQERLGAVRPTGLLSRDDDNVVPLVDKALFQRAWQLQEASCLGRHDRLPCVDGLDGRAGCLREPSGQGFQALARSGEDNLLALLHTVLNQSRQQGLARSGGQALHGLAVLLFEIQTVCPHTANVSIPLRTAQVERPRGASVGLTGMLAGLPGVFDDIEIALNACLGARGQMYGRIAQDLQNARHVLIEAEEELLHRP